MDVPLKFKVGDKVVYTDKEAEFTGDYDVKTVKFYGIRKKYGDKPVIVYKEGGGYDYAEDLRKLTKLERALK